MQQQFKIYSKQSMMEDARKDTDKLAKDGWLVHAMEHISNPLSFCVVYRKKGKATSRLEELQKKFPNR